MRDLGAANLDQEKPEVHRAPPSPPSEGRNAPFMEVSNPVQGSVMGGGGMLSHTVYGPTLSAGPVSPI